MFLRQIVRVSLVLAFLHGGSVWAATYWVSSTGSDGNSCASVSGANDPGRYRTVNGGLSCISPGDTLKIKNGTYNYIFPNNPIPSGSSSSAKTCIVGESRSGVVFRPTSTTRGVIEFSSARDNICIRNLTIDGDRQPDPGVHTGIAQSGAGGHDNWEITDVTIKNMGINNDRGGNGIILDSSGGGHYIARVHLENNGANTYGNGIYWRAANSVIEHSVLIGNANDGVHFNSVGGAPINNNIVRHNIFKNNVVRNVNINDGTGNVVYNNILLGSRRPIENKTSNNKIYNNTVYGAVLNCIRLQGSGHDVRNNIFLNCGGSAISNLSTGSTISNNLTTGKATYIFVSPQTGDFSLKADTGVGATITNVNTTPTATTVLNAPPAPSTLQAVAQ
jgi:hypothetical protein